LGCRTEEIVEGRFFREAKSARPIKDAGFARHGEEVSDWRCAFS
jgi:hypothetical protein